MLLIELATQAVKGFSPQSRVPLRPGYNVLVPPAGTPPGVSALLSALLYNDGRGSDASLGTGQAPARSGLTLQGRDGNTYRLIRNLGGAGALHRLEPSNTWSLVSQDPLQISQLLRSALGLASREQLEELFFFEARQLPSRRPAEPRPEAPQQLGAAAAAEKRLRPNALVEAAMAAVSKSQRLDPAQAQRDIDRLRAEVQNGQQIEERQFQLEGMRQRIFQLEERLKQLDKMVEDVDRAKQAIKSGHSLDSLGLPPDAFERAARFDEAVKKRDEAIQKLREEDVEAQGDARYVQPLWLDRGFQIAAGAGLFLLLLGVFFRGSPAGYLALLDIPAFGYAGLVALKWISELQSKDSLSHKIDLNKDREQKLQAAFDNEYFPIKGAMRVIGVETGKEFLEFFGKRKTAEENLAVAEARLAAARADPTLLSALEEQDALAAQAKQLEDQIGAMGAGMTRDWRDAESELHEIEAELSQGPQAPESGPTALGGSFEPPDDKSGREDPIPKLLASAQDLFSGASLEALGQMLHDRAAQYFVALSDRRFLGLDLNGKGEAVAIAPGRNVPAGHLNDRDLDLLYLSIRLTIVEKLAPVLKLPAILDEPFVGWEESKLQLLSRMLKHIGTMTQVLHATALPAHRAFADCAAQL